MVDANAMGIVDSSVSWHAITICVNGILRSMCARLRELMQPTNLSKVFAHAVDLTKVMKISTAMLFEKQQVVCCIGFNSATRLR